MRIAILEPALPQTEVERIPLWRRVRQRHLRLLTLLVTAAVGWGIWQATRSQQAPAVSAVPLLPGTRIIVSTQEFDPAMGAWPYRDIAIAGTVGETPTDLMVRETRLLVDAGWALRRTFRGVPRHRVPLGTPRAIAWINDPSGSFYAVLESESTTRQFRRDNSGDLITRHTGLVGRAMAEGRPVLSVSLIFRNPPPADC